MKINMQAVLSEKEVEEAIRRYVTSEIPLQEGSEIEVSFDTEGDELTATVIVDKGGAIAAEPKKKRGRAAQAAEKTEPANQNAEQPAANLVAKEDTPPFATDEGSETSDAVPAAGDVPGNAAPESDGPTFTGPAFGTQPEAQEKDKIVLFQAEGSSAPAPVPTEAPAPAFNPKSLFANLGNPG